MQDFAVIYVMVKPTTSFWSASFKAKSSRFALFSVLCGAQHCDSRIHLEIKFKKQPLSSKNSVSWKVSLTLIGLCQKTKFISSGQLLMGKKASPFRILKRSALSCDTSFRDRYLIVLQYSRSADINTDEVLFSDYSIDSENVFVAHLCDLHSIMQIFHVPVFQSSNKVIEVLS